MEGELDQQPASQPKPRVPAATVGAVILLEVIALGSLAFAFLLLLVTGELGLATTGSVTLTAIACVVLAAAAVPAGIGVWRGRSHSRGSSITRRPASATASRRSVTLTPASAALWRRRWR